MEFQVRDFKACRLEWRWEAGRRARWCCALALVLFAERVRAADSLTLEEALAQAQAANARLPLAAREVDVSRQKEREARAERWLKVSLEGDVIYAPSYDAAVTNLGEERFQVIGRQPLYDGGARRAAVLRAQAATSAASARQRMAVKDVDFEVRGRFSECAQVESEITARREGIERLRRYRTWLRSRQASGQGVAADLLKTDVRLATEEADLVGAERRGEAARLELNDLMGRDPRTALELAPLPEPSVPPAAEPESWRKAPELVEAEAHRRSAEFDLHIARAERKPVLFANADGGLWGSDTSRLIPPDLKAVKPDAGFGDRLRRDAGYSLSVTFIWPLWDLGGRRARLAQAELALSQAGGEEEVRRRQARLHWEQARAAVVGTYREIQILTRALPDARDSYLEAESRYRGGAASSLEVLEAHTASVDAAVRLSDAMLRYRMAEALALRWGTP
jgi:outer membrane protein TolC